VSIYIDTSAFYALIDSTDLNHKAAVSIWQRLIQNNEDLVTSSYVVTETIALLHNRLGTDVVRRFVEDNLPVVRVVWVDQTTHNAALGAMLATPGRRGPSLTDCANLEVMRQVKTRSIFAYDQHFTDLGLTILSSE